MLGGIVFWFVGECMGGSEMSATPFNWLGRNSGAAVDVSPVGCIVRVGNWSPGVWEAGHSPGDSVESGHECFGFLLGIRGADYNGNPSADEMVFAWDSMVVPCCPRRRSCPRTCRPPASCGSPGKERSGLRNVRLRSPSDTEPLPGMRNRSPWHGRPAHVECVVVETIFFHTCKPKVLYYHAANTGERPVPRGWFPHSRWEGNISRRAVELQREDFA